MPLNYLDFDYSEDDEGTETWDAMASVTASRMNALAAEIEQLLQWATQSFAGRRGAIEDGCDWDYDLQAQDEDGTPLPAHFDASSGRLRLSYSATGRTTVTLSFSGNAAFGEAMREAFHLES